MVAVPVLVLYDVINIVLVICPQTEGAELSLALVVTAFRIITLEFALLLAAKVATLAQVEVVVEGRQQHLEIGGERELPKWVKSVRVHVKLMEPL